MKYEKILNDTWEYLENNFKASEISISIWMYLVNRECDTVNCLKNCIKLLWSQWEWYDPEEKEYYKKWIKYNYGIIVR